MIPTGFSTLQDPHILQSMDYATHHNFVGRPITGYLAPICMLTNSAMQALLNVQDELDPLQQGYFDFLIC